MGAGRKTQTSSYDTCNGGRGGGAPVPERDLQEALGGVVFGATSEAECLKSMLFGLPARHFDYVRYIEHGLPLFFVQLHRRAAAGASAGRSFDIPAVACADKLMYGMFEAAGPGAMNIDPHAWTGGRVGRTAYPTQVKVAYFKKCKPLPQSVVQPVLRENYYSSSKFLFELTHEQSTALCVLFQNAGAVGGRGPPAPTVSAAPPLPRALAPPQSASVDDLSLAACELHSEPWEKGAAAVPIVPAQPQSPPPAAPPSHAPREYRPPVSAAAVQAQSSAGNSSVLPPWQPSPMVELAPPPQSVQLLRAEVERLTDALRVSQEKLVLLQSVCTRQQNELEALRPLRS